ncbi:MAG: hypothetical protein ACLTMP_07815 [Eggerthella lenta]
MGPLYDTFYMTGDIDVPALSDVSHAEHPRAPNTSRTTFIALGTHGRVDTSRTHCSVVNYAAVPEDIVALGQDG